MVESPYPPLRLLGGSGKLPSKLAALAAARKRKDAEQKAGNAGTTQDDPSANKSLLDRLSTKLSQPTHMQPSRPALEENVPPSTQRAFPIRKRKSPSPPPGLAERRPIPSEPALQLSPTPSLPVPDIRAAPSIFAQAMCGRAVPPLNTSPQTTHFRENIVPSLFGTNPTLADTNPFAGPSPDDVVIQAQAKGSAR